MPTKTTAKKTAKDTAAKPSVIEANAPKLEQSPPTGTGKAKGKRVPATTKDTILPVSASPAVSAEAAPVHVEASITSAQQAGSKQAMMLAVLGQEQGANIAELMAMTGWMSHSVRGFLSAVVRRKLDLLLTSSTDGARGRVYRIELPTRAAAEAEAPLPAPKASRSKKKAASPAAAEPSPVPAALPLRIAPEGSRRVVALKAGRRRAASCPIVSAR